MHVRTEQKGEEQVIHDLTDAAFAGAEHSDGTEAVIVKALRDAGALTLSLVAEQDGAIVGHVAFSPVTIGGEDVGWYGLGPVSVWPEQQKKGIGGALIREGLSRLEALGAKGCVLLGDPGYYHRFGFRADPQLRYPGPPAEYFQCLTFGGPIPSGVVRYHDAFEAGAA